MKPDSFSLILDRFLGKLYKKTLKIVGEKNWDEYCQNAMGHHMKWGESPKIFTPEKKIEIDLYMLTRLIEFSFPQAQAWLDPGRIPF